MLGAMSDWVYNRNPTESLHFEGPLKALKEDLASGEKVQFWFYLVDRVLYRSL